MDSSMDETSDSSSSQIPVYKPRKISLAGTAERKIDELVRAKGGRETLETRCENDCGRAFPATRVSG